LIEGIVSSVHKLEEKMTTISSFGFGSSGCSYEDARIAIFGAPFDATASYRPGARFAPRAIRSELFGLEPYSPYQDKDIEDAKVHDYGDLGLPYGNADEALRLIEAHVDTLVEDKKLPLMIGGEHLVSLGAVRALVKKYDCLRIVQLDAHMDLLDDYLGEKLSHTTVMRRVWELVGDGKIFQFGIRSGKRQEFEFAKMHTQAQKFNLDGLDEVAQSLRSMPIYLTIDLDVLDPSIFPGTGTPEAGGVAFQELLDAILCLAGANIVGCDIVELAPVYDTSGVSTSVACKVLRELVLVL